MGEKKKSQVRKAETYFSILEEKNLVNKHSTWTVSITQKVNSPLRTVSYMEDLITHAIHCRIISKSCELVPQHSWNISPSIWLQTTVSCGKLCFFQLSDVQHNANKLVMQTQAMRTLLWTDYRLNNKITVKLKQYPYFSFVISSGQ